MLPSHVPRPPGPWTRPPRSHMRTAPQDFFAFGLRGLPYYSRGGFRRSFPSSTVKSNGVHRGFDCSPLLDIFPQSCFILLLRGEIRTRPMTPWFRVYPPHAVPATLCITLTKTRKPNSPTKLLVHRLSSVLLAGCVVVVIFSSARSVSAGVWVGAREESAGPER